MVEYPQGGYSTVYGQRLAAYGGNRLLMANSIRKAGVRSFWLTSLRLMRQGILITGRDGMPQAHRNPTRRNRNIGTKKSGYKKQRRFDIPQRARRPFYENIQVQERCRRNIHGRSFTFIVEKLSPGFLHACSIDEICKVLSFCPPADLEGVGLIVLRQPKKKELVFSSCWGRLVYAFDYHRNLQPAIIIEAVCIKKAIVLNTTSISPFEQKELAQLKSEGHKISITGRQIIIKSTLQAVKRTQLYRTVLHEVGHYVDYKRTGNIGSVHQEKETFANAYAKRISALIFEADQQRPALPDPQAQM